MATKDALTSLGAQDKENLLKKSAKTLPANASDKGFSAEQIIKSMYEPSLTNFLYMQRLITELGGIFDSLDTGIGGKVDKVTGKSLISDTEITRLGGMETGAQVNVIEGVQVNGVDLTPTNKKVNVDISGKVDKVSSENKVYVTDDTGAQASAGYDTYVDGDFVRRNNDDQIYVPATPTANTHAASKKYVDDNKTVIADTLNDTSTSKALSAKQGKELDTKKENVSNKVTSFQVTPDNTHYPSEKLVFDELQNVKEVAEGKCKTYVLSRLETGPWNDSNAVKYKKIDGSYFEDYSEYQSYISGYTLSNSIFNSQESYIQLYSGDDDDPTRFFILEDGTVIKGFDELFNLLKKGDNIYVRETDVPDRWASLSRQYPDNPSSAAIIRFYILETAKVDLTPYVQKTRTIAGVDLADDVTKAEMQAALDMDYSLSSAELEDIFTDPVEEEEENE